MRKQIFFWCLFLVSMQGFAQQGYWYLGGRGGYASQTRKSSTATNTQKESNWSFSPEIGVWLSDRVQFGLGINYAGSKAPTANFTNGTIYPGTAYTSAFGGTLYWRYFFLQGEFRPFAGLNFTYLPGKNRQDYDQNQSPPIEDGKGTSLSWGVNLQAGFSYALSDRVAAVGSFGLFGYTSYNSKIGTTERTINSFGGDFSTLGNRFTVGIYFTL
ncbi:MAG: outer membrane beta-barrel protein [Saprospiraceae bacterium]